ncbi:hypothetical protein ACHRVK_07860 [Flavobacterium plurextorum]|uniref:hypothetical protein n=1 Tax=Flavobacterium plurextorum TaxID=1114867 RepID=UPI003756E273
MKRILSLLLIFSLMIGCKSTAGKTSDKQTTSEYGSQEDEMKYYFTATGNEPFWGLKMGNDNILFTSLIPGKEKLVFAPVDAIRAMDANVKMYKVSNETTSATITIQQVDCQD